MFSDQQGRDDETPNKRLRRAFNIDEKDLDANHHGLITDHQRAIMRWDNTVHLFWKVIGILGMVLIFWSAQRAPFSLNVISILVLLIISLMTVSAISEQSHLFQEARQTQAQVTRGLIKLHPHRGYGEISVLPRTWRFKVSPRIFRAFADEKEYALYYAPDGKRLIAAEHVPAESIQE